jgi:uroporphyrinogen III methyltransferase/synthase
MLELRGAEVLEFPELEVFPPSDYGPMDHAIGELDRFDWVIFSGSPCVSNFFARLAVSGSGRSAFRGVRTGAIGHGAVRAMKKQQIAVDYIPAVHTAESVVEGLGKIEGLNFLLVRVEGAPEALPSRLRDGGAAVCEVAGYRMNMTATERKARIAFGGKPDALALANPTAVRWLLRGAGKAGLDLKKALSGIPVAVVGPVTAETAAAGGLKPAFVSGGHIADLAEDLTRFFSGGEPLPG